MTTHAAAVTSIDALRDGRGRFRPGVSGNPAGKPPGTLNQATILKRWMADGDDERLGRQVIERALKGEWAALRFVMERLDPKPRSRPIALDFPDEASFAARCEIVVRAMAAGEISPAEALQAARLLETAEKAAAAERAAADAVVGAADAPAPCLNSSSKSAPAPAPDLNSPSIAPSRPASPPRASAPEPATFRRRRAAAAARAAAPASAPPAPEFFLQIAGDAARHAGADAAAPRR